MEKNAEKLNQLTLELCVLIFQEDIKRRPEDDNELCNYLDEMICRFKESIQAKARFADSNFTQEAVDEIIENRLKREQENLERKMEAHDV